VIWLHPLSYFGVWTDSLGIIHCIWCFCWELNSRPLRSVAIQHYNPSKKNIFIQWSWRTWAPPITTSTPRWIWTNGPLLRCNAPIPRFGYITAMYICRSKIPSHIYAKYQYR